MITSTYNGTQNVTGSHEKQFAENCFPLRFNNKNHGNCLRIREFIFGRRAFFQMIYLP